MAQVRNDDIAQRLVLQLNEATTSSTSNCTVQWNCVDERLTGKCIEYHNDQWFEFIPPLSGQYFVNIENQQCRDVRGVQVVVLTGTPCQPSTYRVLSCTSLGSQDDVFVVLDSLRLGQPYLLNVDGYLRDDCRFTLDVSTRARGLPAGAVVPPGNPQTNRVVVLNWSLPDSVAAAGRFRVWRREAAAFRADAHAEIPVTRSTYGTTVPDYSWSDTLSAPGRYLYQVVAESPDTTAPVLLLQQWYNFTLPLPQRETRSVTGAPTERQQQQQWERRSKRLKRQRPPR